jgi:hypothetical protein
MLVATLLALSCAHACPIPPADTIRLVVGSPQVNGSVYVPHAARVRVRAGAADGPILVEWTNELTLGDSAGRRVMRWVTRGTRFTPEGPKPTGELRQTYDARTLAPLAWSRVATNGACQRLRFDGTRVTGVRKLPTDSMPQPIDRTLDQPGFIASATDLVPVAVGLEAGLVMTAPVWGPEMERSELRAFTVAGKELIDVEGTKQDAWKVEEHRVADRTLVATWYLTEAAPYMVYGTALGQNGQLNHFSEVSIPPSAATASTGTPSACDAP